MTSVLVFTLSRLRAPVVPILVIFGAGFGTELVSRWRRRRNLLLAGLALVVLVVSLVIPVNRKGYALEGLIQAGNIYLDRGLPARAGDEYARAAKLDPNNVLATYGRFNAAAKLKSRVDAERYSVQLYGMSRTPADSVYAFLSTALLGTMTGDFIRARDYYLRALGKDPQNFDTRYLLALVYYTLKDLPNAQTQVEIALSLNPEDQQARMLHEQLGRDRR